ncbi:hypothetical protein FRC06_005782, partial [Ceratobasidium sp. 370]
SRPISAGAIAGVAVGSVLAILLGLGLLVFVYRRQTQDRHANSGRTARDHNGIDGDKRAGYTTEPFIPPLESSTQTQQPPPGYVTRSAKSGPVVQPTTPVGHVYSQGQGQPALSGSNPRSGASVPSVAPEPTQAPQDKRASSHGITPD